MTEWKLGAAGMTEAQYRQFLAYEYAQSSTGIAVTGVIAGLAVTQTSTASGSVVVGLGLGVVQSSLTAGASPLVSNAAKTLDVLGASPMGALPRYDIVIFNADDATIEVVIGTPNAAPVDPTLPPNCVKLARVRNSANATTVPNGSIDDLRVMTTYNGSPGLWQDYAPRIYQTMTGSPASIGTTVNYARWRYLDAHTVQASVSVSRQAGLTVTDGLGVSLPVTGAFRSLNCGTMTVHGTSVPTNQSGIAFMSVDRTKLIVTGYNNAYLNVDPNQEIRFSVTYEV